MQMALAQGRISFRQRAKHLSSDLALQAEVGFGLNKPSQHIHVPHLGSFTLSFALLLLQNKNP